MGALLLALLIVLSNSPLSIVGGYLGVDQDYVYADTAVTDPPDEPTEGEGDETDPSPDENDPEGTPLGAYDPETVPITGTLSVYVENALGHVIPNATVVLLATETSESIEPTRFTTDGATVFEGIYIGRQHLVTGIAPHHVSEYRFITLDEGETSLTLTLEGDRWLAVFVCLRCK